MFKQINEVVGYNKDATGVNVILINGDPTLIPVNSGDRLAHELKVWQLAGNVVPDYVTPTPSDNPVDHPLNRFQFIFMVNKLNLFEDIVTAIASFPEITEQELDAKIEAQILFAEGTTYHRDHTLFAIIAPMVGLTEDQLNTAWMSAKDKKPT